MEGWKAGLILVSMKEVNELLVEVWRGSVEVVERLQGIVWDHEDAKQWSDSRSRNRVGRKKGAPETALLDRRGLERL